MFDVGFGEAAVLVVLALVIFGDKLPQVAQQAGRTIRQLRQMATNAQADLKEGLGPEFSNFDPADLNPKNFVKKHLFDDSDDPFGLKDDDRSGAAAFTKPPALALDERPPFDLEST
ncbi:MAG: sec-independent translocase [Streptosporangiaceae bacterium]